MRLLLLIMVITIVQPVQAGVLTGTVTDMDTQEPLPSATIRVMGTGRSMLANEQGQYRLRLEPGTYRLKFSHVAHYSELRELLVTDADTVLDIRMRPAMIEIPGTKIFSRAYDPAQRIILEAIKRKKEILSRLRSYDFDAYTRFLVLDTSKADSESVVMIAESQMQGFWEQPNKYKEIITARKQTSNLEAEGNLVTIGEILNFNANRIDIARYSIVSPTATDALDYYNYYLIDTVFIDDQLVYRLELEPKNNADPLFVGTIDIADSSFQVVGFDGSFSEGFETPYISGLNYRQRCAQFDNEYWMPVEIRFVLEVDLPIPGFPIYSVDYVAALHDYSFEVYHDDRTFDYVLEVDPEADDIDSAAWYAGQIVPLTALQQRGYERIDSLKNAPRSLGRKLRSGFGWLLLHSVFDDDFFHFNRVEGAYLGYGGVQRNVVPRTTISYGVGYAFDRQRWQHRYGLTYRLGQKKQLDFDAVYTDKTIHQSTLISPGYNPTIMALFDKTDPLDYYRSRGVHLGARGKIAKHLSFGIGYNDHRHYSEVNHTEYSLFRKSKKHRFNPAVVGGTMRSGRVQLAYDSRPLMKLKNQVVTVGAIPMIRLEANLEIASPDLIDNDFDFVRYSLELRRQQRTLGAGLTTIRAVVGGSDKSLPPQRYFAIDFGDEFFSSSMNFKTQGETNFKGSRAAFVYAIHDFRRWLFRRSALPLVRDIPFSLSLHGGVFWTDFDAHVAQPDDDLLRIAPKMYSEIGFGLGRVPPLNFKLLFTWQLSDYDTNRFAFSLGSSF